MIHVDVLLFFPVRGYKFFMAELIGIENGDPVALWAKHFKTDRTMTQRNFPQARRTQLKYQIKCLRNSEPLRW